MPRPLLSWRAGQVWQHRNDLRIPAEGGTRLDFNEFNEGPFPHYRLEVKVPLGKNHGVRALYAPFEITVNGEVPTPLEFNGETFLAEEPLSLRYKFNSYRLSYIYGFWGSDKNQLNLGFTLKVRDAEIQLSPEKPKTHVKEKGICRGDKWPILKIGVLSS